MAFSLTTRAFYASRQNQLEPLIVLEIDSCDLIFGTNPITTVIKYGDGYSYGDPGLVYGGLVVDPNSRDYISLDGTSKEITQQLLQDQGGTSSISTFNITLVDKNGEISRTLIPDDIAGDVLSRNCKVYQSFNGTRFPEDALLIFQGIVSDINYGQGNLKIKCSHPEDLKRQDIFTKIDTQLDGAINDTVTDIVLTQTEGIFESQDAATTYVRIDDEVIQVGNINYSTDTLENCSRGALGTMAEAHDDEADVETIYLLEGNSIELALKLMLSGGPDSYLNLSPKNFVEFENITVPNAIQFESSNIERDFGVAVGDLLTITGAANPENNFIERAITSVVSIGTSSYVIVDGDPLVAEEAGGLAQFKSKWNTLADGLGMLPRNVDVQRHLEYQDTYAANFPPYLFFLKDTINGKEFIDKELYYPSSLYSLPRKGRSSVGYTNPPLSVDNVPLIDERNITNLQSLSISRTLSKDFYNAVVFRFNEQLLEEKFVAGEIILSADSTNRIKGLRNRPLRIDSKGLRRNAETINIINRISDRIIDRYKFAAARISNVEMLYKDGFTIEAGDIVTFGSQNMNLKDPENGLPIVPKLYEVVERRVNIIDGKVRLTLLDTAFDINAKFNVVAPSSIIKNGSSSTRLQLQKSFGTESSEIESDKWEQYIGASLLVHNADFSSTAVTTLVGIDPVLNDTLNVNPPLPFTPTDSYFVEFNDYDDSSITSESIVKNNFGFVNPFIDVTSASSGTVFDVSDASDFYIGINIKVHNDTFTRNSDEVVVTDITGTQITVNNDLGFTPVSGDTVEILNFLDENPGYRII